MKKILLLLFVLANSFGQKMSPVKWKIYPSKEEVKIGDIVEIKFEATIQHDWYIYSNDFSPDLGPKLTEIKITPNDGFQLVGKPTAINPKRKFDAEIWQGEYSYFKEKGLFVQKVKILKDKPAIEGLIDYQSCTEVDGRCIPLKEKFAITNISLASAGAVDAPAKSENVATTSPTAVPSTSVKTEDPVKKNASSDPALIGQAAEPLSKENISSEADSVASEAITTTSTTTTTAATDSTSSEPIKESDSIWSLIGLALSFGFGSIFMPCIYPIMPMTVSYFTNSKDGKKKALVYGLSILVIFAITGMVAAAFGAPFLNYISTHWIPNLIFFAIFVLFGASFLGAFEIVLPSKFVNKIDAQADKGGYLGVFFMALTLVVVSFSCTIPFVGSLLILASKGEFLRPLYGMLAFGLPFALVFTGLAYFPNVLKSMPKSGGWLGELKVVFAILEFALALKFLSNIDLTYHFNLLSRDRFLWLWIIAFVLIGLYIFGLLRMPKDAKVKQYAPVRIFFGLASLAFAGYLAMGLGSKPLSALAGFLPPMHVNTSDAKLRTMGEGLGLEGYADYHDALEGAKASGKPLLIDFTGYACANCRKMEENVWPNADVLAAMKNNFTLASLYVDDKANLPVEKQYVSQTDNEKKITLGDKNLDIEISKFDNNAQPLYCIVDGEGKLLVKPFSYTKDPKVFLEYLNSVENLK